MSATASDSHLASRGRYVVPEPRLLRVLRLLLLLSLPAAVVAALVPIWLRWLPLEQWREWIWDVLPSLIRVLGYALVWKYDLSRRAAAVDWDEDGVVVHTTGRRSAQITWSAVRQVRIPFAFAGTYETAGGKLRLAQLFVVRRRLPYLIPIRWGEARGRASTGTQGGCTRRRCLGHRLEVVIATAQAVRLSGAQPLLDLSDGICPMSCAGAGQPGVGAYRSLAGQRYRREAQLLPRPGTEATPSSSTRRWDCEVWDRA